MDHDVLERGCVCWEVQAEGDIWCRSLDVTLAVHSSINLPCVHHISLVILHTLDLLSDADINLRFALVGTGSPSWLILIHRHLLDVLEGAVQAADVGVQGGAQGTGLDQQISELPYLCVHLSLVFPAGRDVVHNS